MPQPSKAFKDMEVRDNSKVAALDIGSNSFHLVVARIMAGSVQILHRVKQKVRLAEGLDKNNMLSEEAQQRGLDALEVIAESLQGIEADNVRIVATYTLRKARNAKDFIKTASKTFPYPIEVISGAEEARLIYLGVAHTNHDDGQRLVIDIGGGSTEFIIGEGFNTKLLRSLQMGCVSYTKRFFKNGELNNKAFNKAITYAQQELEIIDKTFNKLGWNSCIGCSGTIRTVIELAQQLDPNRRENYVSLSDLNVLIQLCCDAGNSNDLQLQGLTEDRQPVFAAGLAILTAVFRSLQINEMSFSPAALREGVLYEMEEQLSHPDIRQRSADSVATRYDVDVEQARRVLATTMTIYRSCKKDWQIEHKELKSMLEWAALLHEVGLQINTRGIQRHSGYILQNLDLPGFNQEQQSLLATLVRFHRKKVKPQDIPEFSLHQADKVYKLIAILRLSVLLNIKRQDDILPKIDISTQSKKLILGFPDDWLSKKPVFKAGLDREVGYIEELGLKLVYS